MFRADLLFRCVYERCYIAASSFSEAVSHLGDGVSLRHGKDFFDRCSVSVVPSKSAESLGVFIGDTSGGPVVAFLDVFNCKVPLVMSPVIQATGWRIVHICDLAPLDVDLRIFWTTTSNPL